MANVLRNSALFGFSGVLSQLSIHSRHGRVCVSPCFSLHQRNNSTSPKVKVDLDSSTGKPLHSFFTCPKWHPVPYIRVDSPGPGGHRYSPHQGRQP
uniref:Uncharacterized protein n=1 Tax=Hucho hucho TaxID=62062 RepID=A0A4W5KYX7_9TELE